MIKNLLGKKEYEFECLNISRHVQKLLKGGVSLFSVQRKDEKTISFFAYAKDDKKIKEEFKNAHMLKNENKQGLVAFFDVLKKNLLVILSFSICFLSFPFFNFFVWKVEVFASNENLNVQVKNYLQQNQIEVGKIKSHYDLGQIKTKLLENFASVAFVDVEIKNETLVINIREKTFSKAEFLNCVPLICQFDGIVENVNMESGTAKVKKGDFVKAGDILAEAYMQRDGRFIPCEIKGEITVRSFKTFEDQFSENSVIFERTGKKVVKNYFTFFKDFDRINLGESGFQNFETEVVLENAKAFPIIPLKLTSVCFYELEEKQIYVNFEENKSQILQKFRDKFLSEINAQIIFDQKISCDLMEDGMYKIVDYFDFLKSY